jgi:DNA-binding transcriptional LysR family regulator
LHDRFPEVRARLSEADHSGDLLGLLLDEDLDLASVRATELEPFFASVRLMAEPIVLAVAPASELGARGGPIGPADLRSLELIRHRMMPDLEPRLRDLDIEPRYAIGYERSAAIHALAAAGVGAAIVRALAVDADDLRIRLHRLDHLFEPAVMRLAWLRGRRLPPAWSAFVEHALRIVETIDICPVRPALAAA